MHIIFFFPTGQIKVERALKLRKNAFFVVEKRKYCFHQAYWLKTVVLHDACELVELLLLMFRFLSYLELHKNSQVADSESRPNH